MSNGQVLSAILVSAAVTSLIRFLPFLIFRGDRKVPPVINYLGRVLPPAVMAMLVVYCYKGINLHTPEGFLPELIAGLLTVGSYCWKKNTLLSILLGTVTCMVLRQFVF